MTVISDIYFDVAMKLSKWSRHQIIKLPLIFTALFLPLFLLAQCDPFYFACSFSFFFEWTMDFCSILKLARVDMGNVSKKGENMKGIITWRVFARWFLTELCLYMSSCILFISLLRFKIFLIIRKIIGATFYTTINMFPSYWKLK